MRFVFLALALFLVSAAPAVAGITMLPPEQSNGATGTPCLSGEGDKILTWDGAAALKCSAGVTSTGGNLAATGSIKVGNDASACIATKAGTIRWNGTAMQYCNGTAWTEFLNPSGTCGAGTLVQWDSTTKTASCKPIYEAMTCVQKFTEQTSQSVTLACNPGYYIVAGSCWRTEQTGGSENWQGGLFIGDMVSKTSYTCRYEGAAAVKVYITCCK